MARTGGAGILKMRAHVAELPAQLTTGFRAGMETADRYLPVRPVVHAVGMGGAAIAPEIIRGLVDSESDFQLRITRSYRLPASIHTDESVLLFSYSGNTWETLAAYEEAGRRRCARLAICSGGQLAERAERDGVPHVPLPAGYPPRAAVGYFAGALLGVLDPLFPQSNEDRVASVRERLTRVEHQYASARGAPAQLAAQIGNAMPHIYAEGALAPVARRWACQLEENAKRLAYFDEIPEALHNALVGWDAASASFARGHQAVFLLDDQLPAAVAAGVRFFVERAQRRRVKCHCVTIDGADRLESLFTAVLLGDHLSLFVAERSRVDPYPIDVLDEMKTTVAPLVATPPSSANRGRRAAA